MNPQYNTMENFNKLVEKGDIIECPNCQAYNAYAWIDVNMDVNTGLRLTTEDGFSDGDEPYTEDEILSNWPDVYSIPTHSAWEWECRNCKTHWMERNSPLNHPCYTHYEDDLFSE
jgi:hypothetical protein